MRVRMRFRGQLGLLAMMAAAMMMTVMAPTAEAQKHRGNWERIGCEDIGRGRDFDVMRVSRGNLYRALRLEAVGNDVHIERLRVVYGNNRADELRVRQEIRQGQSTRAIDLKGTKRVIKRIEMISKRGYKGRGRGRARVCIVGLTAPKAAAGGNRGWVELGCQKVAFGLRRDRDTIRVGRNEGGFRSLELTVTGNDVFMRRLTVVYGNGAPDDLRVERLIRQGTRTGAIDLKGRKRAIREVVMVYKTPLNLRGSARVCVAGRK